MSWQVTSKRLAWAEGSVLDADDLAGCNIEALVQGGHLAPVANKQPAAKVDGPRRKMKVEPDPEPDIDDSAEEPEEQE